jgi:hypothetical protein
LPNNDEPVAGEGIKCHELRIARHQARHPPTPTNCGIVWARPQCGGEESLLAEGETTPAPRHFLPPDEGVTPAARPSGRSNERAQRPSDCSWGPRRPSGCRGGAIP